MIYKNRCTSALPGFASWILTRRSTRSPGSWGTESAGGKPAGRSR